MKHANNDIRDIFHKIYSIKYVSGFFMFCFVFCNAVFRQKKQRRTRAYEQQHLLVIQYDTFSKYLEKETTELINL